MNCSSGLLTDYYQLAMLQGYFYSVHDQIGVFDMFYRRPPFQGGFAVFAGLDPMIDAVTNISFSDEDIAYLKSLNQFGDEFLDYLRGFKFTGDMYAVAEGTVVFPNEPLIRVHGKMLEAQLIETLLLNIINFQTLIATKTARIQLAAKGGHILEFGMRRAQGIDGAISATRAAFIGGAVATSNVYAGKQFDIPVKGTMAHSWVMSFSSELESFQQFARIYPDNCVLLVDTYDTLKSGVKNAITVLTQLQSEGHQHYGIRLDSGDLAFLSIQARKMLDDAGLKNAKIIASNDLDEWVIRTLIEEGARIDSWGVGTQLITGGNDPALSGVYKLSSKQIADVSLPCMKLTNNPEKMSNPGIKNIYRFYDKHQKMTGDLIYLDENSNSLNHRIKHQMDIQFNHPSSEFAFYIQDEYQHAKQLLTQVVKNGHRTVKERKLTDIQKMVSMEIASLDTSHTRLLNPHIYKISITNRLKDMKLKLVKEATETQ